jgi:GDPmannose 4,6-dehydratase
VSRKITRGVASILAGQEQKLFLGNLEARRDWGFAPEYVEGMWRMLQQAESQHLVFGTGETHAVQEFVEKAFAYVNRDWRDYVAIDPLYLPTKVPLLQADPSEAKRRFGWEAWVRFRELMRIMLDADWSRLACQRRKRGNATFPMGGLGG